MFGLEIEGLSPEDAEFEIAKKFVRLAGTAAKKAAAARASGPAAKIAKAAILSAAKKHAPGIVKGVRGEWSGSYYGHARPTYGRRNRGVWYRRGSRIILSGV